MPEHEVIAPTERLDRLIREVRGEKVMLDSDLARVYGVSTKALNQAVKRNANRFPADFAFRLAGTEWDALRSQSVTSKGRGGRRHRPYAFTEHGALMAANVLSSARAAQMSVYVVRAFLAMRRALADNRQLASRLAALEKDLKERLDVHESAIVTILQRVMEILDPPPRPEPPRRQIGFTVKERIARYGVCPTLRQRACSRESR